MGDGEDDGYRSEAPATRFEEGDLRTAHALAAMAAPVAMSFFGRRGSSELKSDGSPVGEADLAVDALLVAELVRLHPEDGVLSEESPEWNSRSGRRWIIDPVDGTYAFLAGDPHWGTNVALEVEGEVVLGVVTRPALGQVWWAVRGGGAFRATVDGHRLVDVRRLHVSTTRTLSQSTVSGWPVDDSSGRMQRLRESARWVEPDMTILLRLLDGEIDVVLGLRAGPWDWAPAVVLVEEAGGCFSDLHGGRSIYKGCGVFMNGDLAKETSQVLAPAS